MSGSTRLARHVRKAGEGVGYIYPEEPTEVELRGPTPVLDCLTPRDTSACFPLPLLTDPTDGVAGLDEVALAMIRANHETNRQALELYQAGVRKSFGDVYSDVNQSSLDLDNNLTLTSELIGHVDGTLTDLARSKLLSLFKGRARAAISRKMKENKDKEEEEGSRPAKGLLGGDSDVKESLQEVTKGDDLVGKVLHGINLIS